MEIYKQNKTDKKDSGTPTGDPTKQVAIRAVYWLWPRIPRTREAREAIRNDNTKLKEIQIQARSSRISRFVFYTCAFKKQNKKLRRAQRSKQTLDLTGG